MNVFCFYHFGTFSILCFPLDDDIDIKMYWKLFNDIIHLEFINSHPQNI